MRLLNRKQVGSGAEEHSFVICSPAAGVIQHSYLLLVHQEHPAEKVQKSFDQN